MVTGVFGVKRPACLVHHQGGGGADLEIRGPIAGSGTGQLVIRPRRSVRCGPGRGGEWYGQGKRQQEAGGV